MPVFLSHSLSLSLSCSMVDAQDAAKRAHHEEKRLIKVVEEEKDVGKSEVQDAAAREAEKEKIKDLKKKEKKLEKEEIKSIENREAQVSSSDEEDDEDDDEDSEEPDIPPEKVCLLACVCV